MDFDDLEDLEAVEKTKGMRVLLIGGTGFIGRSVAQRLLADGHTVVGLARSNAAVSALTDIGVEPRHVRGGLLGNPAALTAATKGCNAAIDVSTHNFRAMIPGIQAIRSGLDLDGVMISTTGTNCYGDVPGSEEAPVSEEAKFGWEPRKPELWPKDLKDMIHKISVEWPKFEAAVLDTSEGYSRTCIIRPGIVCGGAGGVALGMVKQAMDESRVSYVNDGRTGPRGCVHVDDLADLYALALTSLVSGVLPTGSILNATSGMFTHRGLADAVAVICGNLPLHELTLAEAAKLSGALDAEEKTTICVPDASKAQGLGWKPTRASLIEDVIHGSYAEVARSCTRNP